MKRMSCEENEGEGSAEKMKKLELKEELCPAFEIFNNNVILRHMEKFVSFADWKNLRLVCRQLNYNILEYTKFTSRAVFTFSQDLISSGALTRMTYPVKYAKVMCFRGNPSQRYLCREFGAHGNSYEWHQTLLRPSDRSSQDPRARIPFKGYVFAEAQTRHRVWSAQEFDHVYEACKFLKELSVTCDAREFKNSCLCDTPGEAAFPMFPSVKRILQSAKSLKKLALDSPFLNHLLSNTEPELKSMLLTDLDIEFLISLSPALLNATHLRSLRVRGKDLLDLEWEPPDTEIVRSLISKNKETLENLSIHLSTYHHPAEPPIDTQTMKFPKLKSLEVFTRLNHGIFIVDLLRNHKHQIQSLTLIFEEVVGAECLVMIFEALPAMTQLEVLRIHSQEDSIPVFAFAPLRKCALKVVDFDFKYCFGGTQTAAILSHLPSSVRKVSLCSNYRGQTSTLSVGTVMNLANLTSLHLYNCEKAVQSDGLHAIFLHMTSLTELLITKASSAFGSSFATTPVTVSNLQALEKLILAECCLTEASFQTIRLPKLRFLDISGNDLSASSLRFLLEQNPMLQAVRYGSPSYGNFMMPGRDELLLLKAEFSNVDFQRALGNGYVSV